MDQPSIGDGGPPRVRTTTSNQTAGPGSKPPTDLSSLSKSLFVDCSVEYELPMVPKIPPDSQPLLVIHPGWQQKRRITRSSSQQRLIYEEQQRMALQQHQHQYLQYMSSLSGNTVCSQCPPANAPGNHAAPQSQTQPTQASATAVMQPPRPVPNPNIVATSTATATTASSVTSRKRSYQASNLPQIMPPPQQPLPQRHHQLPLARGHIKPPTCLKLCLLPSSKTKCVILALPLLPRELTAEDLIKEQQQNLLKVKSQIRPNEPG